MSTDPKVLLVILDGIGEAPSGPGNAVKLAAMPYLNQLRQDYPTVAVQCASAAVGLPAGTMGNSEVGHLTIGAGRVVWSKYEEINRAIADDSFYQREKLVKVLTAARERGAAVHLVGMLSDAGVHSHEAHLYATLEACRRWQVSPVYLHIIADGRDVPPCSVNDYLARLEQKISTLRVGQVASLAGRYWAMDRDKNYDRTAAYYELLVSGAGQAVDNIATAVTEYYATAEEKLASDYYLPPLKTAAFQPIQSGDVVLFWNFRTDRAIQLSEAFLKHNLPTPHHYPAVDFLAYGPYVDIDHNLFPEEKVSHHLGAVLAARGLKQLRIAETEKYAHVTFFFNAQIHEPFPGEDRELIPSPKVPNYAEAPAMSAPQITDRLLTILNTNDDYAAIILNYANGDLVGHSGDLAAAEEACASVDNCLARLVPVALAKGYTVLVGADHGNSEQMLYPDGSPCMSHTTNPVLYTIVGDTVRHHTLATGCGLSSIAPTILQLLHLPIPPEMTGRSLLA